MTKDWNAWPASSSHPNVNKMINEQNQKLIETTREVTQQGRELAETAEKLVEQDAQARREMVAAHKAMRTELHDERVSVDRQRENVEQERQAIAKQRVMQPIIAEAIKAAGLWLACLLPLLLAGYVIYAANRSTEGQAALNEMLVLDLTSGRPRLLPQADDLRQIDGRESFTALPAPESGERDEDPDDGE